MSGLDSEAEGYFKVRPLEHNLDSIRKADVQSDVRWEISEAEFASVQGYNGIFNQSPLRSKIMKSQRQNQSENKSQISQVEDEQILKKENVFPNPINPTDAKAQVLSLPSNEYKKEGSTQEDTSTAEEIKRAQGQQQSENSPVENIVNEQNAVSYGEGEKQKEKQQAKPKLLKFRTELESVHEVENWKEYNKEESLQSTRKTNCSCKIF